MPTVLLAIGLFSLSTASYPNDEYGVRTRFRLAILRDRTDHISSVHTPNTVAEDQVSIEDVISPAKMERLKRKLETTLLPLGTGGARDHFIDQSSPNSSHSPLCSTQPPTIDPIPLIGSPSWCQQQFYHTRSEASRKTQPSTLIETPKKPDQPVTAPLGSPAWCKEKSQKTFAAGKKAPEESIKQPSLKEKLFGSSRQSRAVAKSRAHQNAHKGCRYEGCVKYARDKSGWCIAHGGGKKCKAFECKLTVRRGPWCKGHSKREIAPKLEILSSAANFLMENYLKPELLKEFHSEFF